MRWLLARVPSAFQLSCQTLVQLIEASLSRDFTPRVFAHHQERAAAGLSPEEPAPIIQLYNAVLAHVAEKVTSQELSKLSWPPCEFWQPETSDFVPHLGWNSVQHLSWLRKAILSLQLPQWTQLSGTGQWLKLFTFQSLHECFPGCAKHPQVKEKHKGVKIIIQYYVFLSFLPFPHQTHGPSSVSPSLATLLRYQSHTAVNLC